MQSGGDDDRKPRGIRTRLVNSGRVPFDHHGFVNTPIYRGSTVLYPNAQDFMDRKARFTYGTKGTPTIANLEQSWTELSGAAGTVLAPSGLAAIALALTSVLSAGDHMLVTDSVYRPTRNYCDGILKRFGVETEYYDPLIGAGIEALMRPNTRAVFTEAPGSQSFEMQDIPAIAEVAHRHDAIVLVDNTWATPLYFPPHERGADIAIEAGTKYLGGHSDVLLGLVSANERCWKPLRQTFDAISACAGPEDAFLASRGLRTMPVRLAHHEKAALEMARWFEQRAEVLRVLHPALESHPGHSIWKRDFFGSSGLFSVVFKPVSTAKTHAFVDALRLFGIGASWGGFESLVLPFDCSEYRTATQWNPGGPCIRFHIGLENLEDLVDDLERGFAAMTKA
ncbi:cystathionine beta-lyase MetC [Variibacter gotjawalensis]|uniref:Cystathionine beta-lyase MetC n=1 Tax=Variibacter gotjawalensis TaxID=1333996 RepID=A0A0S3PWZ4_9BRAD|nr:cystathionine beta-lyase [Variibacter gotjawalensis]NIK46247.1 cystathionine beta-lyase [Variibacter gotjawalensis]RZS48162.1 cystathionine beta-lyase [Variibacter gotjawalensis]BAT60419.1 cystathionine beta-lyase MetC [Variibacter gotjawalensis]